MVKKEQYKPLNTHDLDDFLKSAMQKPWHYSFYQISRLLNAHHTYLPRIGNSSSPNEELIQFSQKASLYFPPREIAKVDQSESKTLLQLYGLGLFGPNGPLPIHFTEIVKERIDSKKDHTLANFLNLFNHRYISLMYKTWAQSKPHVSLDRDNEDYFSRLLIMLAGLQKDNCRDLPVHAHLSMLPLAIGETKSPYHLEAFLNHFFNVPLHIDNYALSWLKLEKEDYCYLGNIEMNAQLGEGAILGKEIPDCQSNLKITIGPMDFNAYMRFTPNSEDFLPLVEIVRSFVGYELDWQVQLIANTKDVPATNLDGSSKLGWNAWLGKTQDNSNTMGINYTPEKYMSV